MNQIALCHSPARNLCDEFNLVLQSVALESEVVLHEGRYYLLVDEEIAEQAYHQLKQYVEENRPEEKITRPLIPVRKGLPGAYLYAAILILFGVLQWGNLFGLNWEQRGLADSWKIADGQWWRAMTALTLHADVAHITSNIGFGILFGLLVSQHTGAAAAWLMILLSGTAGNLVNAWFYKSLHLSLGASTAVFAALGMLGVFTLEDKPSYGKGAMRRALPLVAAIGLLVMTGTGGGNTDLLAHLSGFISGGVCGIIWVLTGRPQITDRKRQIQLAITSLLLIVAAWTMSIITPV